MIQPSWLNADGSLNPQVLLDAFLKFWRQHGEPLFKSANYPEIAPHLVMIAFLHRVVNGNGTLEREYAIGSGKMDICLRYGKVTEILHHSKKGLQKDERCEKKGVVLI